MNPNHKAVLFSTRFIEWGGCEKVKYLFKESMASPFQSKALCDFFRSKGVVQYIYRSDSQVKEELFQLRISFKEEMQKLGIPWEREYDEKTEKAILKEIQNKGGAIKSVSVLSNFFNSRIRIINNSFIDRYENNPSHIISNVMSASGDVELPELNIGSTKGTFRHRFQIYELPKTIDSHYSVYSVWDLKSACFDGTWENALCEEIIQRGKMLNLSYSDIYLFLHDKDLFTQEKTFGVKDTYQYVGDPSIVIHVAYFKHEYPDPVYSLLVEDGVPTEDVATRAINLIN